MDRGGFVWAALGFLLPPIGLILSLAWKGSRPKSAKSAGRGAVVCLVIVLVCATVPPALEWFTSASSSLVFPSISDVVSGNPSSTEEVSSQGEGNGAKSDAKDSSTTEPAEGDGTADGAGDSKPAKGDKGAKSAKDDKTADSDTPAKSSNPKEKTKSKDTDAEKSSEPEAKAADADEEAPTIDFSSYIAEDGTVDWNALVASLEAEKWPAVKVPEDFPNPFEGEWGTWKDGKYKSEALGIRVEPKGVVQPAYFVEKDMSGEPDFRYATDLGPLGLALMNIHDAPNLDGEDPATMVLDVDGGIGTEPIDLGGYVWYKASWVDTEFDESMSKDVQSLQTRLYLSIDGRMVYIHINDPSMGLLTDRYLAAVKSYW